MFGFLCLFLLFSFLSAIQADQVQAGLALGVDSFLAGNVYALAVLKALVVIVAFAQGFGADVFIFTVWIVC
jgi:hypothetical protein